MKKYILFAILAGCASGGSIMTMNSFYDIPIGSSPTEVVSAAGKPYAIHNKTDGTVEYEYIERIKAGARDQEERHYFLLIKDGRVVSKRVEQSSPAPWLFDSYDMQTTLSGSSEDNQ